MSVYSYHYFVGIISTLKNEIDHNFNILKFDSMFLKMLFTAT